MNANLDRSEKVVSDFKEKKQALHALKAIHRTIDEFDKHRQFDWKAAKVGISIVLLIAASIIFLSSRRFNKISLKPGTK